jgi:hypothetical protein
MKYIEAADPKSYDCLPTVELTRRNLETLLAKLDDERSQRTLVDGQDHIAVRAVENEAHYSDRPPGTVFMPSTGEYL